MSHLSRVVPGIKTGEANRKNGPGSGEYVIHVEDSDGCGVGDQVIRRRDFVEWEKALC